MAEARPLKRPRQKRYHAKVATGCKTCRRRRVKCGEEKPCCQRCINSGYGCEGYENIRLAQTDQEDAGGYKLRWVKPSVQLVKDDRPQDRDRMLFDYFRLHVLDQLSAPFDTSWCQAVLRSTLTSTAVWHAAVALSCSIALGDEQVRENLGDTTSVLSHYGKAMQLLQQRIKEPTLMSANEVLVTCLLFVALEFQKSGFEQAMYHLQGGLDLVSALQDDSRSSTDSSRHLQIAVEPSLVGIFRRLDVQMSMFTSTRIRLHQIDDLYTAQTLSSCSHFADIAEADQSMWLHMAAMRELVFMVESLNGAASNDAYQDTSVLQPEVTRQLLSLTNWEQAMWQLLPTLTCPREVRAAKTLQVHCASCQLLVASCQFGGQEILWDHHMAEFERLLDLAEDVALLASPPRSPIQAIQVGSSSPGLGSKLSPSLEVGTIPATYLTTLKCRDRGTRQRAMNILRSCRQREGPWDGLLMASMAQTVAALEESQTPFPDVISEKHRLYQATFEPSRYGMEVVRCKRRMFEEDGRWVDYWEPGSQTNPEDPLWKFWRTGQ